MKENEDFVELAHDLAEKLFSKDSKKYFSSDFQWHFVAEKLIEQTGVIGEKIEIGAFGKLDGFCRFLHPRW